MVPKRLQGSVYTQDTWIWTTSEEGEGGRVAAEQGNPEYMAAPGTLERWLHRLDPGGTRPLSWHELHGGMKKHT